MKMIKTFENDKTLNLYALSFERKEFCLEATTKRGRDEDMMKLGRRTQPHVGSTTEEASLFHSQQKKKKNKYDFLTKHF